MNWSNKFFIYLKNPRYSNFRIFKNLLPSINTSGNFKTKFNQKSRKFLTKKKTTHMCRLDSKNIE